METMRWRKCKCRIPLLLTFLFGIGLYYESSELDYILSTFDFGKKKMENKPKILFIYRKDTNKTVKINETELLELIYSKKLAATLEPEDENNTQICDEKNVCKSVNKYIIDRAQEYIKAVNAHLDSDRITPTLRSFPEDMLRPSPLLLVKDTTNAVNYELIRKELDKDKKRRMELGDDDLLKIPEISEALQMERANTVPNIVHFIWYGCHRFRIHHYLSLLGVWQYQLPSLILFHTNCMPEGSYWESFQNVADKKMIVIKRTPPNEIFGKPIKVVEHQSDVTRLQILLEVGGIYLDDDIIVLKSMDDLRSNDLVLGEENYDALGNGVILAQKNSWFLNRWFQEYQNFDDSKWSDSSCFLPWSMWQLFPDSVTVVKEKMLRPNWEELHYLYEGLWNWRNSYTIHLYSRFISQLDVVEERTMEELSVLNTTYGEVARHVIWGDYHVINPSEMLVT